MTDTALMRVDPQALMLKALESNAGIETLERLVALAKDVREIQAKEAWYTAMANFQYQCPTIIKTSKGGGGAYTYWYASLDEVVSTIQPVMGPLGLSISWQTRIEPKQVVVVCRVSHLMGHHEDSGEIAMPITEYKGTGADPAQRVGIALTYAKRYSLLGIIGKAPEDDEDGHTPSGPPSAPPASAPSEDTNAEIVITENQVKKFSAIAHGMKWSDEQLYDLLSGFRYNHRTEIRMKDYDTIIDRLKQGPPR